LRDACSASRTREYLLTESECETALLADRYPCVELARICNPIPLIEREIQDTVVTSTELRFPADELVIRVVVADDGKQTVGREVWNELVRIDDVETLRVDRDAASARRSNATPRSNTNDVSLSDRQSRTREIPVRRNLERDSALLDTSRRIGLLRSTSRSHWWRALDLLSDGSIADRDGPDQHKSE